MFADANILLIKEIYATPTTHGAKKRRIALDIVLNYVYYVFNIVLEKLY